MQSYSPRFLLICLMLVLLPLQGFASTGWWAFVHDNIPQVASGTDTNDTVSAHEHCDTMQQDKQVSARDAHVVKPDLQNHCKGASPCCILIALLLQQPAQWFLPATVTVYPMDFHAFSSAPARALERPPKKFSV
ncbi:hypothetical protein [Undibacterium sp. WLX3042]|uniref:hypothetical protein n=1 Tax=Undibacterium sp. WLX3042 TaxID=3412686 RepID=UPI003C2B02FD